MIPFIQSCDIQELQEEAAAVEALPSYRASTDTDSDTEPVSTETSPAPSPAVLAEETPENVSINYQYTSIIS